MARIHLPLSKTLDITWDEIANCFFVRLLQGTVYITPKLEMTPYQLRELLSGQPLQFGEWMRLTHFELQMTVRFKKESEITTRWLEFIEKAQEARGGDPVQGWQEGEKLEREKAAQTQQ